MPVIQFGNYFNLMPGLAKPDWARPTDARFEMRPADSLGLSADAIDRKTTTVNQPVLFQGTKKRVHKACQVAQILPKGRGLTQADLDKVYAREDVARIVQDKDWYQAWHDTVYPKQPGQKPGPASTGYCYPGAEFWYFFVDPDTKLHRISYDSTITNPQTGEARKRTHYFLTKETAPPHPPDPDKCEYKDNGRFLYDVTRSQYKKVPPYNQGVGAGFLTEFPSKKACTIAVALGLISPELADAIPRIFRSRETRHLPFEAKLALLKTAVEKDQSHRC